MNANDRPRLVMCLGCGEVLPPAEPCECVFLARGFVDSTGFLHTPPSVPVACAAHAQYLVSIGHNGATCPVCEDIERHSQVWVDELYSDLAAEGWSDPIEWIDQEPPTRLPVAILAKGASNATLPDYF